MNKTKAAKLGINKSGRGVSKYTITRLCSNCSKNLYITKHYQTKKEYKNFYCDKNCEANHRKFNSIEEAIRLAKRYKDKNGYVYISCSGKHYLLHRVLMEQKIGRKLLKTEHVHHLNGNPSDNRLENLEIISNKNHPSEASKKIKILQARIRELEGA